MLQIGIDFENQAIADGYRYIAGVDEVGRGCLAGAVVAAACILDLSKPLPAGLIDAVQLKDVNLPQKSIIKGDAISASIAAASILAKTYRDNLMQEFCKIYPQYGFSKHVGYGTKAHFEAIREHGVCPLHRKSFRGVIN
jgi:ribonuclease HII